MTSAPPPPEKSHPLLSQQPPSKSWGPVKPHFLNLVGGSTPPSAEREEGGAAHYVTDWDWQTETWAINKAITYSTPRTLEFKSCPVFLLWPESSIEVWLTDRQTGETGRPKDKHVGGSNTSETSYI